MNSARERTARNLLEQTLTSLNLKIAEAIQRLSEYDTLQGEVKALEKVKTHLEKIRGKSGTDLEDVEVKNLTTHNPVLRDTTVSGNLQVTASRFLIDGIPLKEFISLCVAEELDGRKQ